MNKRRLLFVVGVMAILVAFMISCNSEPEYSSFSKAEVTFAPAASKALNQGGSATQLSTSLTDYHWKYYCSTAAPVLSDTNENNWQDFQDAVVGLGTIKDLFKGDSYYFGLRGYLPNTSYTDDDLIWEGWHYENTATKQISAVTLNTKKQLITIDVYSKGLGYLYFNITAPLVLNMGFTSGTCVHPDRFYYAYESLDGTVTGTNFLYATYTSTYDSFDYADESGSPKDAMPAGVYLFTIKQQTWDPDSLAEGSSVFGDYVDVEERAQIIIINIVSGVDTVIGGSLDSKGMVPFEYNAYSPDDQHGMQLRWHQEAGTVSRFEVTAKNSGDVEKHVYDHSILRVEDNDFVTISWTTDADITLYMNGDKLSTATDTDGYYIRAEGDEKWTYIKALTQNSVKAYGKAGTDYIITLEYDGTTMSFTIRCSTEEKDASKGSLTINNFTTPSEVIIVKTAAGSQLSTDVKLTKQQAKDTLPSTLTNKITSQTSLEMILSVSVYEKDYTADTIIQKLSMKAKATVTSGSDVSSEEYDIDSFANEVQVSIMEPKYLKVNSVSTSGSNLSDDKYSYTPKTGELVLTITDFGDYEIKVEIVKPVVRFMEGTSVLVQATNNYGGLVEKPFDDDDNKGLAFFYEDSAFTTEFDFENKVITADTDIYIKWKNSFTVIFMNGSTEYASLTDVRYKALISAPSTTPSNGDYPFQGWFKESYGVHEWLFASDKVKDDIYLYAGFRYPYMGFVSAKSFQMCPSCPYPLPTYPNQYQYCISDPLMEANWLDFNYTLPYVRDAGLWPDGTYRIYWRNKTDHVNTVGSGEGEGSMFKVRSPWAFDNYSDLIYGIGTIEAVYDYQTYAAGGHMFNGELPEFICCTMFEMCKCLASAPALPVCTSVNNNTFRMMFHGCSNLKTVLGGIGENVTFNGYGSTMDMFTDTALRIKSSATKITDPGYTLLYKQNGTYYYAY